MSYVGGPGFELYVPIEMARHVYLALHEAGLADLRPARRRLLRARRAAHRGRPPRLGRRARPRRDAVRGRARCSPSSSTSRRLHRPRRRCSRRADQPLRKKLRDASCSTTPRRLGLGRRGARSSTAQPVGELVLGRLEPAGRRLRRPRLRARRRGAAARTPAARSRSTCGATRLRRRRGIRGAPPSARRQRSR